MAAKVVSDEKAAVTSALTPGGNLTVKFGPGFDAPWLVIQEGNTDANIAWLLKKFGGKTHQEVEEAELAGELPKLVIDVIAKLQLDYAESLVENGLGGKPESSPPWKRGGKSGGGRSTGNRPAVPTAGGGASDIPADDDPQAGILAEIAEATDKVALQTVFARNQAAFTQEQKDGGTKLRSAFATKLKAINEAADAALAATTK